MKKLFSYVLVLFCVLGLCCNVYATETTPTAVVDVVDEFFECLEDNEICVFDYISIDSSSLENTVKERLYDFDDIDYTVKDVVKTDYGYDVTVKFDAEGRDWNVSGFTAEFNISMVNYNYVIVDTDFFEKTGTEAVGKFVGNIFGIVIGFIIGILIFVVIVIVAIILIIRALAKKKK